MKACRGGGGNASWAKGSSDDHMYSHVVATVAAAVRALPAERSVELAALLYLQGESDDEHQARAAGQRLSKLAENLRRDLPHARRMCVLVAGIAAPGARRDLTRAGQRSAAQDDARIEYFSTLDPAERLYDGLHFDREAKLAVGRRFARRGGRDPRRRAPGAETSQRARSSGSWLDAGWGARSTSRSSIEPLRTSP